MATKNYPPSPPTDVRLNGVDVSGEMSTRSLDPVKIGAKLSDPNKDQMVQLVAYWSTDHTHKTGVHGPKTMTTPSWVKSGQRGDLTIGNLAPATKYYVHLYTRDKIGRLSKQFTTVTFWTNRTPKAVLVQPVENSEYNEGPNQTILFDWQFEDADAEDKQSGWQLRYRETTVNDVGATVNTEWKYITVKAGAAAKETFIAIANPIGTGRFKANKTYEWSVRVRDLAGVWSEFAIEQTFFIRGLSTAPTPISPIGRIGTTVITTQPTLFTWKFNDPNPANKQKQADIRWRVEDTSDEGATGDLGWFTKFGGPDEPLDQKQWEIPAGSFQPGFIYEWQVRTYDVLNGIPSEWSASGKFVTTGTPGSALEVAPILDNPQPLAPLGCGDHRVFIYLRGGKTLIGEIKPLAKVQWGRLRDDISNALITTNGFGADCCELLGSLRSWMHEVVIFRDNDRVFEGPITRLTYTATDVEIEAKDVMAYLYRRIIRQGFNDRYQRIDITPKTPPTPGSGPTGKGGPYTILGQNTVVERALQITINALAYQDPNVLPYVTAITNAGDAKQQSVVYDYQKSAWEEIDSLAANKGLDYTTVGRRIIYWDTNRPVGRLPEMRDGDFQDPVIVTEYGMQTANYFAITNNAGTWGAAYPAADLRVNEDGSRYKNWFDPYGPIEMTSSTYSEDEAAAAVTEPMNRSAKSTLVQNFETQAKKALGHRWPTPVVCRVPDNSRLSPDVNLSIQQLVPGVWIPLRATMTCRNIEQWQKLDSVTVTQERGVETIQVTMSPAPLGDADTDADAAAEAAD